MLLYRSSQSLCLGLLLLLVTSAPPPWTGQRGSLARPLARVNTNLGRRKDTGRERDKGVKRAEAVGQLDRQIDRQDRLTDRHLSTFLSVYAWRLALR